MGYIESSGSEFKPDTDDESSEDEDSDDKSYVSDSDASEIISVTSMLSYGGGQTHTTSPSTKVTANSPTLPSTDQHALSQDGEVASTSAHTARQINA